MGFFDIVNEDEVVRVIAKIRAVSPKLLNSEENVEEIRQARAEAEQIQMQMARVKDGAEIAKTVSEADKNMKEE